MTVTWLAFLLLAACSADIPPPKLLHLPSGDLQLSVDNVPGMKVLEVKYSFPGATYRGTFKQAEDGRWYHINTEAKYTGKDKMKYMFIGLIDGKTVVSKGKLRPGKSEVAISPPKTVRRGTVVFRDDFNGPFDPSGWDYEVSMYGGYNGEFQAYVPEARNVFTRNGHLFIKPTLTRDHPNYNDGLLFTGVMDLNAMYGYCTDSNNYGCFREGKYGVLPPVMSGKLKSKKTIRFGQVVVSARVPRGDWIWPAIWMLPKRSEYGQWPRSGEIDMMESRGNSAVNCGGNHGFNEVGSTLHWGPDAGHNQFMLTHGDSSGGYAWDLHTYTLDWTVDHIQVSVDGQQLLNVQMPPDFWHRGGYSGTNLWAHGTKAAPFDKDFYLILNVAVGGTSGFFSDDCQYNSHKPWNNHSPTADKDFWNGRNNWLPSWHGDDVAMEIDYVQMTQY